MVILITGISSGFGLAMARQLQADGHTVYGTVRREVEQIPGVHYLRADVRDTASVRAAVEAVLAAEGRIDVLINNAGMGIGGALELATAEEIEDYVKKTAEGFGATVEQLKSYFGEELLAAELKKEKAGKLIVDSATVAAPAPAEEEKKAEPKKTAKKAAKTEDGAEKPKRTRKKAEPKPEAEASAETESKAE